ncbi:MAG: HlyC/CorC family transporter [Devosia nanyangense]|uniref:HlyC/CorC family transporter n=1 Tax=Devosia nanyangense TaxID=1228055 RepID=A0A933L1Q6_9HYPH|nr:HlyC/CorC family transporter [Devosia nanyangense]
MIVLVLTLVNGLLAMSELAVVSARPARLKVMAADGNKGAAVALKLAEDPGKFLSSVQIGITLVGILSGAFSGATLGDRLTEFLLSRGLPEAAASTLGVGLVVVAITYISLILGELVPKQIALRDAEGIAARVAPSMRVIASVGAPLVFILDVSGRLVLRLLGQSGASEDRVTDEEVKTIIAEAESQGVLESEEKAMISGVMRFADRSARGLMTPRLDVEVVDLSDPPDEIQKMLRTSHHSMLPVHEGEPDKIIGVLVRKDLIDIFAGGAEIDVRALVQPAPVVLDRADALSVLRAIRSSPVHVALVFDEYGHFEGIVTPGDILGSITGGFQDEDEDEHAFTQREDGSYLVSGWMPVDEFADKIGVPIPKDPKYETVAGFVLAELNHLPAVGESFVREPWRIEVLDLDGRRIDKILVGRIS